ncbi:MAG: tetratricopeptide repeat protein, partial [Flavobacteriales bacterium]
MRVLFYLLLVILGLHAVKGQEVSLVPGLLEEFRSARADTARARLLGKISFNQINTNLDSAKLTGEQALALATRINDPKALCDAHHSLGWLAATQGDLDSAEVHMNKALALSRSSGGSSNSAPELGHLGWLAQKRGDDVGALKYFIEALGEAEAAQDSSSMASMGYSIGTSYRKMGDFSQALTFLNASLEMERLLKRPNKQGNCLIALANCYSQQRDTIRAMDHYERAARIFEAAGNNRQLGLVEENIGKLLGFTPERALPHLMLALAQYNKVDSKEDKAYIMLAIGTSQINLGRFKEAQQMLDAGRNLAVEIGARQLVMNYERVLGGLYANLGDAEAVMVHYEKYLVIKDSLQSEHSQQELARLRTAFDTERKEKDNIILRAQNN